MFRGDDPWDDIWIKNDVSAGMSGKEFWNLKVSVYGDYLTVGDGE